MTSASVWIHYVIQPVQQTLWLVRIAGLNLFRFGKLTTHEIITGYTLLLGKKLDVTPHSSVRPTSCSEQCNGAKQKTSNEPRHGSAPFHLRDFCRVDSDRKPKQNYQQTKHHQPVTAL